MKKLLIIGLLLSAGYWAYSTTKKDDAETLPANDYEGKTVQNTGAKNWSVVIGGKRYGYVSGSAYSNYAKSNPAAIQQNEIGDSAYNAIPEGGYIDENGNVVNS